MLVSMWLCAQSIAATAAADDDRSAVRTRWGCQVEEQHLSCVVERSDGQPAQVPADRRLPAIVRDLRQRPASWRGRMVRIPLFNHPFDDSSVRQLAQAVLCGAAADCEAVIGRERWNTASALLDFADANDPLLQHGE